MNNEKQRLALFFVTSVVVMFGWQLLLQKLGYVTQPVPVPPPAIEKKTDESAPLTDASKPDDAAKDSKDEGTGKEVSKEADKPKKPEVILVPEAELTLGSTADKSPEAYRLQVVLSQGGGGISAVQSAQFDAEYVQGKPNKRPLTLISGISSKAPSPLSMTLRPKNSGLTDRGTAWALDAQMWDVVRGVDGKTIQDVTEGGEGQSISLRTTVDDITVTKTFTLRKGRNDFEVDITVESPKGDKSLEYTLMGPHGIPIEGEWYTSTFRDIFFGRLDRGKTDVLTRTAYDISKDPGHADFTQSVLPLLYAGVENQYFATFLAPKVPPKGQEDRIDSETNGLLLNPDTTKAGKDDIGVSVKSRSIDVGPSRSVTHSWLVYAGPKDPNILALYYGADQLSSYRKNQWFSIPGGAEVAYYFINPMLRNIYSLTKWVAQLFGYKNGNYGIAIILLTMTVRLIMFPLGRKSAMMAKKAQDLAPEIAAIKEKYKDDNEAQARETFALYKRVGFNPAGGCLPALIQMPIFVGLWQALNNSVNLRHASFLYINNLAAPDMLFRFPVTLPQLGDYFNLLPFIVVGLMLVQTKLFSPPAMNEEQRQQQSMMKLMMIFMAFMFYKVPSGLGLYFITSSSWQICERLLLPKMTPKTSLPATSVVLDVTEQSQPGSGGGSNSSSTAPSSTARNPDGWLAKIEKRLQAYVEEAQGSRTIRNSETPTGKPRDRQDEPPVRNKNRPKPPGGRGR